MKYRGATKPTWDEDEHNWKETAPGSSGTELWMTYNQRHNSKFKSQTFYYEPTSEGDPGEPGDSWIGVYFDASWWADNCAFKTRYASGIRGGHDGDIHTSGYDSGIFAIGLLPFYPRDTDDSYETPREYYDSTQSLSVDGADKLPMGGGLMIELIEKG